jgi:hypothetical protein
VLECIKETANLTTSNDQLKAENVELSHRLMPKSVESDN